MKDVNSSNASTRQPTPGPNDSKALFESSLENFQTSKSNFMAQAGSKLNSEKAAPPSPLDSDWNSKGHFGDSKPRAPPVKANKNEYGHSTTKLPSLVHQPAPSWQTTAAAKPSNENKRTLYNPVSGKQRNADKAGYASGVVEGYPTSHQRTAAWARSKRESVDFEGVLANITLGASGAVGNTRKQPEGYVIEVVHFAVCVRISGFYDQSQS